MLWKTEKQLSTDITIHAKAELAPGCCGGQKYRYPRKLLSTQRLSQLQDVVEDRNTGIHGQY
jgi:hypothetical protein